MKVRTKSKVSGSKPFKFAFMQHFGSFPYEVFVCVGMGAEETEASARKLIKEKNQIRKVWDSFDAENMDEYFLCRGWTEWYAGGQSILWLRKWGTEEFRRTLSHEIVHVIDYFYKHTMMDGLETRAYLQEHLYSSIKKNLDEAYKKYKATLK